MLRSLRVASGLFAACAITVLVIPVQAAGAATHGAAFSLSVGSSAASVPSTRIKIVGSTATFKPDSLSTVWSGPVEKTCGTKKQTMMITNSTSKNQKITYDGSVVGLLPVGDHGGICFWGTGSEQFTFGILKSTSTLTVSVT